jgi:hypothetical protein
MGVRGYAFVREIFLIILSLFTSKASEFANRRECPLIDAISVRKRTGLPA